MTAGLDILNRCMDAVNERSVTTFDSIHPTAQKARAIILRVNTRIQSVGWWFNKEYDLTLSPLPDGSVILPSDTLKVSPRPPFRYLTRRNGKFYDPVRHTYNLGHSVPCDVIIEIDLEDLPPTAYEAVATESVLTMFASDDGDGRSFQSEKLINEAQQAMIMLRAEHLRESRVNSTHRPAAANLRWRIMQNYMDYVGAQYPGYKVPR